MHQLILSMAAERFLMAALESTQIQRAMQAEGRTEMTDEEKKRFRAATDTAEAAAGDAVSKL